ncbi:MAG: cation transporting ATPase C-terminal domain-containing protein, partial [Methanoregula sp.]|nr:cation transporting ATPase C-terminal domain-containing protein [Methanoregula sp.]
PFMWLSIIVTGSFVIIAGILQLATGFLGGTTPEEVNTVFFAGFILTAVWNGINCRALDGKMPPFFKGNPTFFVVMCLIIAVQVAIVQYGGAVFSTVPLSPHQWVTIIIATASVLVVGLVLRVSYRAWKKTHHHHLKA